MFRTVCAVRRLVDISYVLEYGRNSVGNHDTLAPISQYQLQVTNLKFIIIAFTINTFAFVPKVNF